MKKITKIFLMIFAIVILSTSVFAASVSRSMPARVSPGDDISMVLSVSGATAGELFTLRDQAPQGWRVDAWDVTGAEGGKEAVEYQFVAEDNKHGFSFNPDSSNAQITFTVKVPNSANGDYKFTAVYFDKSGFNNQEATTTVRTITCGDNVCEGDENSDTCVQDCPLPPPPSETAPTTETPAEEEATGVSTGMIMLIALVVVGAVAFFLYSKKKKPAAPAPKA